MSSIATGTAGFVRPQTAQQAVVDALREAITTGQMVPGAPVVQGVLAEQFGISRIPIREALKVLDAEELVRYQPHTGYTVTKLELPELLEVFRLRRVIEADLLRAAIDNISDEVIENARAAMVAVQAAAAAGDLVALGKANRRFHLLPLEPSGMKRGIRILNQLWDTTDPYRTLYADSYSLDRNVVNSEHEQILAAIEKRDVDSAIDLLDAHQRHSKERVTQALASDA
jgi:DNA-binding GntR family transcriptional regulator